MELFHSQFRVDDDDHRKAVKILDAYCKKHNGKYLICLETAQISNKLHLQGWVTHYSSDNTFRSHMSRKYTQYDNHQKCFTPVKGDLNKWISYIINNDNKEDIHLDSPNLFTNYTDEEFAEFKLLDRHLRREEFLAQRKSGKSKVKDWYDQLLEAIEEHTIANNNTIDYRHAMTLYLANPPRYTNPHRANDTLRGIFLRLEQKYTKNKRCHSVMKCKMMQLEEDLYQPTTVVYDT